MSPSIELSVMNHHGRSESTLEPLLKKFSAAAGIDVNLSVLHWPVGHATLNNYAIHHRGPDVSEVGTTWVSDLIVTNGLRMFTPEEFKRIALPEDFLPASLQTCRLVGERALWAVPWLAETYSIHYRKDLLAQAGIDEESAFVSLEAIEKTVARLKESGVEIPVELPLQINLNTNLHSLASWVWASGQDFTTPDGRQVLFNQPHVVQGIRRYLGLLSNLSRSALLRLRNRQEWDLFRSGESAIYFASQISDISGPPLEPVVEANHGLCTFPSPAFVGGSNLVVWNHSRQPRLALQLVRFLASSEAQAACALPLSEMPARVDLLTKSPFDQDPLLRSSVQGLMNGQSYISIPLWGLIEDRLVRSLLAIWEDIAAWAESGTGPSPFENLEPVLLQHLDPLTKRLNITLSNYCSA